MKSLKKNQKTKIEMTLPNECLMFNGIIQRNTTTNSSKYTFVYSKPTFLGLPITEINFTNRKFPRIEKLLPVSWNSHSNSRNEK